MGGCGGGSLQKVSSDGFSFPSDAGSLNVRTEESVLMKGGRVGEVGAQGVAAEQHGGHSGTCGHEFKFIEMNLKGDQSKVSTLAAQGCMGAASGALARDPVLEATINNRYFTSFCI